MSADLRTAGRRLARLRGHCDHLDARLISLREAIDSCHRGAVAWRRTARIRSAFRARAAQRSQVELARQWSSLQTEAEEAARYDDEQRAALDLQLDQVELTARVARSDYEDLLQGAERPELGPGQE